MPRKSLAKKPQRNWDLEAFFSLRLQLEGSAIIMSSEPKSTIQGQEALAVFRVLSQLPDYVSLLSPGEIRPDACPQGFFVLYEYPFKIGFKWPFSPLSRAFMAYFEIAPGQLMPQFWRVLHVLECLTHGWESAFGVADLLTAYTIKSDGHHRYYPFSKTRGDKVLVLKTQVNDRHWKSRYVFVRTSSLQSEGDWQVPSWNNIGIFFLSFGVVRF